MPSDLLPLLRPIPKPRLGTARGNRRLRDLVWLAVVVLLAGGWWLHMRQFTRQHEIIAREVLFASDTSDRWKYSERKIEHNIEQTFSEQRIGKPATYRQRLDAAIQYQEEILQTLLSLQEKSRRRPQAH